MCHAEIIFAIKSLSHVLFYSLAHTDPASPSSTMEINESRAETCEDCTTVKTLSMLKTKVSRRGAGKGNCCVAGEDLHCDFMYVNILNDRGATLLYV